MNTYVARPLAAAASPTVARRPNATAIAVAGLVMCAGWWVTRGAPGWVAMWVIAGTEFLVVKVVTLRGQVGRSSPGWIAAYMTAWPGMNAAAFLRRCDGSRVATPRAGELGFAVAKLAFGLVLVTWATCHATDAPPLAVAWIGMLGIIFTLHFGAFHLVSWLWRWSGVDAPPIMRAPLAAPSLAEFWSERWNVAFAESARRLLLRPLARRWGVRRAGAFVFLASGLVHETVISLPARGGWGGPTLYFLLQAAGIAAEKSDVGRRFGLGRGARGWAWMLAVTALPLPLLFHAPFAERVILPLFRFLKEAL
ncbi:MAG: MBOAT family protein [Opitutaceae bacterium]